jgi:WD40 repeat protein
MLGHTDGIMSVVYNSTGNLLASGGRDGTVRIWNTYDGKCLAVLHGHTNWVRSVVFNHDDTMLASGGDDCSIRLWQLGSSEITCNQVLQMSSALRDLAFSPVDKILAAANSSKEVTLWDISESR